MRKLTITLDKRTYGELQGVAGSRNVCPFIESLIRSHVIGGDLEKGYREMAQEEAREQEALSWAEGTIGDVADETR